MKKLTYMLLWLIGIMGILSVWIVSAEDTDNVTVTFMDEWIVVTTESIQKWSTRDDTVPTPDEISWYDFDYRYVDWTDSEFDFDTPFTQDTLLQAHRTFKARIPNWIYTWFNESSDITVIWDDETLWDIHLTLARNSLPWYYYWWWNEPANSNWSSYPTNWAEYNNNWWWGWDNIDNSYDDWNERYKRQWPCPDGFHIPSKRELNALAVAWCNIYEDCYPRYEDTQIEWITWDFRKASDWTESNKMIWMNKAWLWTAFRNTFNMGSDTDYRSSSPNIKDTTRAYSLWAPNYRVAPSGNGYRNYQFNIRCFKNYVAVPPIEITTISITWITLPVWWETPTTSGISSLTEWINLWDLYRFNSSWDKYNSGFVVGQTYELHIPFTVANWYKLQDNFTATFSWYQASYVSSDTVAFEFIATAPNNPNLTVTHHTDSNISYTLNWNQLFTWVWTISISDWTDTITILDRNLWASAAWIGCEWSGCTQWDPTYWYHFQRWNNWWFDINDDTILTNATWTQVPASEVTVWYSNWTFVTGDNWTDDNSKIDMWWWNVNDWIDNWKVTNAKERQWPCPDEFHVPSIGELLKMEKMMWNDPLKMHEELLIPYAGWRDSTEIVPDYLGHYAHFWSSTPYSTSSPESLAIVIKDNNDLFQGEGARSIAVSLRCFYNSYETYSEPWNNNKQTGWYSWWWWRSRSKTNNEHFSADDQDSNTNTDSLNDSPNDSQNESLNDSQNDSPEWQTYKNEFEQAYEFAYKNWITTMDTLQKANMEWWLTRIAMAKMLSKYAINVLWKKPANIVVPNFKDITSELDEEYDFWVNLAYQLGIMWINMSNNKFRPFDLVTRAEFATALSRMLFSTPDWNPYYSTHLSTLKEEKIITIDNPDMQELRGYVLLMLMRSAT